MQVPNKIPEYKTYMELANEKKKYQEIQQLREEPVQLDVYDEVVRNTKEQEAIDEFQELSPKAEKLLWHYRLGHAPFTAINQMAQSGELPRRLTKVSDPKFLLLLWTDYKKSMVYKSCRRNTNWQTCENIKT
jgi:hypothetical protein